jgi:hypothetical protein
MFLFFFGVYLHDTGNKSRNFNPFIMKHDTRGRRQGINKSQYTRMTSTSSNTPRRMWVFFQCFDKHCIHHIQFLWKLLGLIQIWQRWLGREAVTRQNRTNYYPIRSLNHEDGNGNVGRIVRKPSIFYVELSEIPNHKLNCSSKILSTRINQMDRRSDGLRNYNITVISVPIKTLFSL